MKKIPMRKCIACGEAKPKSELIRIVKSKDGNITIDKNSKLNGRGAYICDSIECVELCIKKHALNRAFSMDVSKDIYEKLKGEYLDEK